MTPGQSYKVGEKGTNRVRLFHHRHRWTLEWYEGPHRRREPLPETMGVGEAKQKAEEKAASLRAPQPGDRLRLDALCQLFLRTVTPGTKSRTTHYHHHASARRLRAFFGDDFDVAAFSEEDTKRFADHRRQSGDERIGGARRVAQRTAAMDLRILRSMLLWAIRTPRDKKQPAVKWLAADPLAKVKIKHGKPTRVPALRVKEYERLRAVADFILWLLLTLCWETGHRLSSVRRLRWADINWAQREVRWAEEYDKEGNEHATPLSKKALAALRKAKPRATSEWVIPHPTDSRKPMTKDYCIAAWSQLERKAGVPHQPGLGWHSIRRAFATRLKYLPTVDLADLGGWADPNMVLRYQKPSPDRLRAALDRKPTGTDTEPSHVAA